MENTSLTDLAKIEDALKTIREVCKSQGNNSCEHCPLCGPLNNCSVMADIPEKWKLRSDECNVNKLFV